MPQSSEGKRVRRLERKFEKANDASEQALEELRQRGVGTSAVHRHADRGTGVVTVSLDAGGHASYEFAADTAWDALAWSEDLARLAAQTADQTHHL